MEIATLLRAGLRPADVVGITLVLVALAFALAAPALAPYDPNQGDLVIAFQPPGTPDHILGTDELGRDLWSRLIWGARPALIQGVLPVLVATLVGYILGIISGFGGAVGDTITMRVVDIFIAIPPVLMGIAVAAALGPGLRNLVIAMTAVLIAPIARVSRGTVQSLKERDYVRAARSLGAPRWFILLRHIVPNALGPTLAYAFPLVGIMVVFGAGLSFVGLGVQPPTADWGRMVNEGRVILATAPHVSTLPGLAIFIVGLGFILVGDWVQRLLARRG
ncbi:MAG: ABC transporter permease [bacterium]|nr:ABC transporter permease [bacterium]